MRQIYWLCVAATSCEQFLLGFILKIMKTLSECLNTALQRGLDIFVFRFGARTHLSAPPQRESWRWLKSFTADQVSVYTDATLELVMTFLTHSWHIRFHSHHWCAARISPMNLHVWPMSFTTGLKPRESAFPPNISFWYVSTRNWFGAYCCLRFRFCLSLLQIRHDALRLFQLL